MGQIVLDVFSPHALAPGDWRGGAYDHERTKSTTMSRDWVCDTRGTALTEAVNDMSNLDELFLEGTNVLEHKQDLNTWKPSEFDPLLH